MCDCVYICIHVRISMHTHSYTTIKIYGCTGVHIWIYEHVNKCTHSHTQGTHTHTHTYTYTHTHTHTHIYIYIYIYIYNLQRLKVFSDNKLRQDIHRYKQRN